MCVCVCVSYLSTKRSTTQKENHLDITTDRDRWDKIQHRLLLLLRDPLVRLGLVDLSRRSVTGSWVHTREIMCTMMIASDYVEMGQLESNNLNDLNTCQSVKGRDHSGVLTRSASD